MKIAYCTVCGNLYWQQRGHVCAGPVEYRHPEKPLIEGLSVVEREPDSHFFLIRFTRVMWQSHIAHKAFFPKFRKRAPIDAAWLILRKKVRERDHFTCQDCGQPGKHVHHIIPKSQGGPDEMSNLVTLCVPCHRARHPELPSVLFRVGT